MNLYLVENVVGLFLLDDEGKIKSKKLYSESFKKEEIGKYLLSFSLEGVSQEIINLIQDLFSKLSLDNETLTVEDNTLGS